MKKKNNWPEHIGWPEPKHKPEYDEEDTAFMRLDRSVLTLRIPQLVGCNACHMAAITNAHPEDTMVWGYAMRDPDAVELSQYRDSVRCACAIHKVVEPVVVLPILTEDIVRMTIKAFNHLAPLFDCAKDFVPDGTTIVYLEPRTHAVAYYIPGGTFPYGYVYDQDEPQFETETEMLVAFVIQTRGL